MQNESKIDRLVLPILDQAFGGRIEMSARASTPSYSPRILPPAGAPNVVVVLLDDVGFGQISSFGGPVETPNIDALSKAGLRYTRFHTTAMCSPTRAALLTGRNHHSVGFGHITECATGFPGYNSVLPRSAATLPHILRENGYATAAIGKWHNTPEWEMGPTGPFDRWPTGLGFEYYYGFMGAECNQYEPALFENTTPVEAPGRPENGYILDADLADKAISFLHRSTAMDPERPFFLWYAPGTAHSPLQAPKDWVERYRGLFDHGWDEQRDMTFKRQKQLKVVPNDATLTPRPTEIPAWSSLSNEQKMIAARYQEAFAGAVSYCDHQIGRVVDAIEQIGRRDNTLFLIIVGDNGPSAEGGPNGVFNKFALMNGIPENEADILQRLDEIGGPTSNSNYPCGWAWAGASPLQWFKQIASHLGAVRNGLIVSWPKSVTSVGEIRSQFHHCIDIAPTILEAAGIPMPRTVNGVDQSTLDGVSMCYSFRDGTACSARRQQYFEMVGNRAMYGDGWMASARHGALPWQYSATQLGNFADDRWELYDLDKDFSQANDLAQSEVSLLTELKERWFSEAGRNGVLPLDDRRGPRFAVGNRPNLSESRMTFRFHSAITRIPEALAPNVKGRSHRFSCKIDLRAGDEGVLVAAGGRFGGYVLLIQDGRAKYAHNLCAVETEVVVSQEIPTGLQEFVFEFQSDEAKPGSGGLVRFYSNGLDLGGGRIKRTIPNKYGFTETFNVGRDSGSPVVPLYSVPFAFSGHLEHVVVDILSYLSEADRLREKETTARLALENE